MSRNVPFGSLFVVQFLVLPSSCEVSSRKQFQKTPVNTELLEIVIQKAGAQITHGGQVQRRRQIFFFGCHTAHNEMGRFIAARLSLV